MGRYDTKKEGGRSMLRSLGGEPVASKRVTVFGGSGFLGRQIVKSLAAEGMNIRVGVRHPERATFLERFGRGGQIELMHADVWDESTVAQAVKQSASVVNTVGHYVEKGGATFDAVHGQGEVVPVGRTGRQRI
jgi:NADH dehydrogenase